MTEVEQIAAHWQSIVEGVDDEQAVGRLDVLLQYPALSTEY